MTIPVSVVALTSLAIDMSTSVTNYKFNLDGATWIDINSRFTLDRLPDRVSDDLAITHSSLFNLFNCSPGERARSFQPEYGSRWRSFIHEPISDMTAAKMQLLMFESIVRWEPRIQLDMRRSSIEANYQLPGYVVRLAFTMPNLATRQLIQFEVPI